MRLAVVLAPLLLTLLAGCQDADKPGLAPAIPADPAPPAASFDLRVVVTQETPDGSTLRAEVTATPLLPDGSLGSVAVANTDQAGTVRFDYDEPTTVLVRATGPAGWTTEGARVHVGAALDAPGFTASDRDLFLPLYRDAILASAQQSWTTTVADVGAEGAQAKATFAALTLPPGLEDVYLARLRGADVTVRWDESATNRASLAAALAWDGIVHHEGPQASPMLAPGPRSAQWGGDIPVGEGPALSSMLQAAAVTRSAIVGDVLLGFEATLRFGGVVPPELPAATCHATVCPVLPPLPPALHA